MSQKDSPKSRNSPNPDWQLGKKIASPVSKMVRCEISKIPAPEAYKLLIGAVVPRPIALVSTRSSEGIGNLAPFSFFNGVSSKPLCLVISVTRRPDGSKKDTLVNIESTGEFVVNTVAEWMIEPVNHCSGDYPYGVDEMEKVGLTPLRSELVKPPRVMESPIHFECRLLKTVEIGEGDLGSACLVIGKIELVHVAEQAYRDGRILFDQIRPISRLAGNSYGLPPETFDLARPKIDRG